MVLVVVVVLYELNENSDNTGYGILLYTKRDKTIVLSSHYANETTPTKASRDSSTSFSLFLFVCQFCAIFSFFSVFFCTAHTENRYRYSVTTNVMMERNAVNVDIYIYCTSEIERADETL